MADSYIDFGVDVGGVAVDLSPAEQDGLFTSLVIDYSSTSHLGVTITNGTTLVKTVLTQEAEQFTIETSGSLQIQLEFDEIPEYPEGLLATDMVRITRLTPTSELERTFVDGSVLKASDLNTQNKQLLYGIQERGSGDIKIDTDGKLDAAANTGGVATQIKNVASPENENEVVTRGYVDDLQLYGTVFGAADPQFWSFTTSGDDIDSTNRVFTLDEPTPSSETDNMYLVEVGGVLQSPNDYTVTSAGTVYSLTFANAAPEQSQEIENDVGIAVRNFGVSRNVVVQPYINATDSTVALRVQRKSGSTSASLQEWQDENGSYLSKIDVYGNFRVGSDSLNYTEIQRERIEVGAYSQSSNAAGIQIRSRNSTNPDGSEVLLSAKNDVGNSDIGFLMTVNDGDGGFTNPVDIRWDGDITTKGDLRLDSGHLRMSGSNTIKNATRAGVIYFGTNGPVMQNDTTILQTQDGKVLVNNGDLEIDGGDLTVVGDITAPTINVTTRMTMDGGGSRGIISDNQGTHMGRFYFSDAGPSVAWDNGGGVTGKPRYIARETYHDFDGGHLNVDGEKIVNMGEPEDSDDAATMNYVDTVVATAGPSVTGGWQYLQAPAYNGTAVDNITFAANGTGASQIDYSKYSSFRVQWHKGDTQSHHRNVSIQFKVGSTWTTFASPDFPVQSDNYGSSGWLEVWNVDTTADDARWFGAYQFRAYGSTGDTVTDRVWDPGGDSVTGFRIQSNDDKKVRGVFQLFGFYTGTPLI